MKKIFIIHAIDKSIWGDKIDSNRYFASITLLFCTIMGAVIGGYSYLDSMIDLNINISITSCLCGLVTLVGLNIAESIMAATDADTAVLRSLLVSVLLILGFGLGVLASVIMLVIITIILGIWFFILFIRMLLGGTPSTGGRGKRVVLDDGTVLTNGQSDLLGGGVSYRGDDGNTYHSDDGEHFEQR